MNMVINIFNPYTLLVIGVFVEYFPSFYGKERPSIELGSISLYIADISFIFLCVYVAIHFLTKQPDTHVANRSSGKNIQKILGLFFVISCFKWLLQSEHDVSSIRMMASFSSAYLFLYFLPLYISSRKALNNFIFLIILFQVYIFVLHIYAFSTEGFKMHILSGGFLTMLGLLYFLNIGESNFLKAKPLASLFIKTLVIATYFMVGHRSGLIALLLGILMLSFFYKKTAIREASLLMALIVVGAGASMIISPDILSKIAERAATTFDTKQATYQGRYNNLFRVIEVSAEHPIIGKPLVTNESREAKLIQESQGGITASKIRVVVTPHNLFFEWLYYYGAIGVLLGLAMIFLTIRFIKGFLRKHREDSQSRRIGISLICCMIHNLFFALTNVTSMSVFATFFLYLPLVMLVVISRKEESYYE
ncbi:MAG: O-antigen ligase family protein [Gammaproteobacteria bacterium]|nr:O-antigen ligase family protein [Gammaproteobacteria bacterium]